MTLSKRTRPAESASVTLSISPSPGSNDSRSKSGAVSPALSLLPSTVSFISNSNASPIRRSTGFPLVIGRGSPGAPTDRCRSRPRVEVDPVRSGHDQCRSVTKRGSLDRLPLLDGRPGGQGPPSPDGRALRRDDRAVHVGVELAVVLEGSRLI